MNGVSIDALALGRGEQARPSGCVRRRSAYVAGLALAWAWAWGATACADAVHFSGHPTLLEGLGAYDATLVYTPHSADQATLAVTLTNTSPAANGGYLTGFVLNNPSNKITSASVAAFPANFGLLGLSNNGINAQPFGDFDFGAALAGGSFQGGGGNPHQGIGVGATETFTFSLLGNMLDLLSAGSFLTELSAPRGKSGQAQFVARFRGFADGGSDKVPLGPSSVIPDDAQTLPPLPLPVPQTETIPEPASLAIWSILGIGAAAVAWRRGRRKGACGVARAAHT